MHLKTRNVNTAFREMVRMFHFGETVPDVAAPLIAKPSRVGEVISWNEPVILSYAKPLERVLFNAARDANPFFHLYESLWMLTGRQDIAPLQYYSSNYAKQVQDGNSPNANGAYGYRWRNATAYLPPDDDMRVDQLKWIISHLRLNPTSRRAVLAMWNVEDDLLSIGFNTCPRCGGPGCYYCDRGNGDYPGEDKGSKDVCCNLCIKFSVETGVCNKCGATAYGGVGGNCPKCKGMPHDIPRYLNMTVFNRSNDLVWGALGANYVHFSILQEYMAAHLGLDVGVYNQVSDDLHIYTERWKPEEWLKSYAVQLESDPRYEWNLKPPFPLVKDLATFDKELPLFVESFDGEPRSKSLAPSGNGDWAEPFLDDVARPMLVAFAYWKAKEYARALDRCKTIQADDWKIVATNWIERRIK